MNKAELRKADLVTGMVALAGGIWYVYHSSKMLKVTAAGGQVPIYVSPGILPFLTGIVFSVLAMALIVNAVRAGVAHEVFRMDTILGFTSSRKPMRAVFVFASLGVYSLVFLRILPYWLSTFIYLVVSMLAFKAGNIVRIAMISAATTAVIVYTFGVLAKIPLP